MADHPIERRAFLAALAAAFLAACTDENPTAGEATSGTTIPNGSTTETTISATSTTSRTTSSTIDPLDAPAVELGTEPFALGVTSGEPDHESVVLWTRIVDGAPDEFEMVWEVADDPGFVTLVATGLVTVGADSAHSVRVVAAGLEPATVYWYRFRAGAHVSGSGRTKTSPAAGSPASIALGVSSCQARSGGAWAAHHDLAEADLDAVVWLGDYIYGEHATLADYRAEYETYGRDPALQASRAAHPWLVFADDHEVVNDYDGSVDPARRAAAYRAWWEHQPTRLPPPDTDGRIGFSRSFRLGPVLLVGLDTRQYADGDSLLGDEQWAMLDAAITEAAAGGSGAPANQVVIASPVVMSGLRDLEGAPLVPYSIDAHPAERRRMASLLAGVDSPIIVSGDLHTSLVADFSADPLDAAAPAVAVEIMAPAISSQFPEQFAPLAPFLPLVNPNLREVTVRNGWLRLLLATDGPTADFHFVDDVADPASAVTVRRVEL